MLALTTKQLPTQSQQHTWADPFLLLAQAHVPRRVPPVQLYLCEPLPHVVYITKNIMER